MKVTSPPRRIRVRRLWGLFFGPGEFEGDLLRGLAFKNVTLVTRLGILDHGALSKVWNLDPDLIDEATLLLSDCDISMIMKDDVRYP